VDDAERARRFEMHLPLRYRRVGAALWSEGRIENISRSGVLFWTADLLDLHTPLEITFGLSVGEASSRVICRGRIVRTVLPPGRQQAPGLAATISRYRFVRRRAAAA
jgi:hypothetical protein